jgi:DNA gyrase/topoisomerase IV subunit B
MRPTAEGGSHVEGIEEGLRQVFGGGPASPLMQSLVAVLHVLLLDPGFSGPTRGRLDSPEAVWLVADAIANQLPGALNSNPQLRDLLEGRLPRRR